MCVVETHATNSSCCPFDVCVLSVPRVSSLLIAKATSSVSLCQLPPFVPTRPFLYIPCPGLQAPVPVSWSGLVYHILTKLLHHIWLAVHLLSCFARNIIHSFWSQLFPLQLVLLLVFSDYRSFLFLFSHLLYRLTCFCLKPPG